LTRYFRFDGESMEPQEQAMMKAIIEQAVKNATDGMVSIVTVMTVGGLICSALVSAIGALFLWVRSLTTEFAAKIETLNTGTNTRVDQKEEDIRKLFSPVIEDFQKRILALEASKKLATDQYNNFRDEVDKFKENNLGRVLKALEESNELAEMILITLEKRKNDE